jgi:hypothetical protein
LCSAAWLGLRLACAFCRQVSTSAAHHGLRLCRVSWLRYRFAFQPHVRSMPLAMQGKPSATRHGAPPYPLARCTLPILCALHSRRQMRLLPVPHAAKRDALIDYGTEPHTRIRAYHWRGQTSEAQRAAKRCSVKACRDLDHEHSRIDRQNRTLQGLDVMVVRCALVGQLVLQLRHAGRGSHQRTLLLVQPALQTAEAGPPAPCVPLGAALQALWQSTGAESTGVCQSQRPQ